MTFVLQVLLAAALLEPPPQETTATPGLPEDAPVPLPALGDPPDANPAMPPDFAPWQRDAPPPDDDLRPPAASPQPPSLGWELAAAALGASVPTLVWFPALGMGAAACALVAMVWPASGASPTLSPQGGETPSWTGFCCWGCSLGVLAWLVAIPSSMVSGALVSLAAAAAGAGTGMVARPAQWRRAVVSAWVAVGAGVVLTVLSCAAVLASGATYLVATFSLGITYFQTPRSTHSRLDWAVFNVAFVGLSGALLATGLLAALGPAAGVWAAYAGTRKGLDAVLP